MCAQGDVHLKRHGDVLTSPSRLARMPASMPACTHAYRARYSTSRRERRADASEGVRGPVLYGKLLYLNTEICMGHVLDADLVLYGHASNIPCVVARPVHAQRRWPLPTKQRNPFISAVPSTCLIYVSLSLSLFLSLSLSLCIYIYIYIRIYIYIYIHIYIYIYIYIYISIYLSLSLYIYIYIYIYTCSYLCTLPRRRPSLPCRRRTS